ncbi:hypothetical protein RYX36_004084 [Vicia faba]
MAVGRKLVTVGKKSMEKNASMCHIIVPFLCCDLVASLEVLYNHFNREHLIGKWKGCTPITTFKSGAKPKELLSEMRFFLEIDEVVK